jgi:phosphoglycolate phosphatase
MGKGDVPTGRVAPPAIAGSPALDHVIFDWNGTLLADAGAVWKANNDVLAAFGSQPISMSTLRETWDIPLIDFYVRHGCDRARMEANLGQLDQVFAQGYQSLTAHARTRAGARQLLAWLGAHNVKRVILSNYTTQGISVQLKRLRLLQQADLVLGNESLDGAVIRRNKEEKLVSYLARVRSRNRVVIVGDGPEEVDIGRQAGIWTIAIGGGICSTRRLQAKRPHFLVDSLHQAMAALREIGTGSDPPHM